MEKLLDKDSIPFQTEGRLLQELGLRLVASPEVAIVELIKNAYDADSPTCYVRLEDRGKTLVILDEGHGMTLDDFKTKWMRIATSSKATEAGSPIYDRKLTGAKGIGRFAVRYLGDHLALESVSFDKGFKCKTRLRAEFEWPKIDLAKDISKVEVGYSLTAVSANTPTGTRLVVRQLRGSTDFTRSTELRDNVLGIVSPLQGLERGKFENTNLNEGKDPGFKVVLPGEGDADDVDLAKLVLDSYWGRLTIQLNAKNLQFRVWLPGLEKPKELDIPVKAVISRGFFADIRYFPRRAGVFYKRGVNGKRAWKWVRSKCGVKLVDHGFHIHPYGFEKDDWLHLDRDKSHSERDWQTEIAKTQFPVSAVQKTDPAENPVLNLASNFQLVGAVFCETRRDLGAEDKTEELLEVEWVNFAFFGYLGAAFLRGLESCRAQSPVLSRRLFVRARRAAATGFRALSRVAAGRHA